MNLTVILTIAVLLGRLPELGSFFIDFWAALFAGIANLIPAA